MPGATGVVQEAGVPARGQCASARPVRWQYTHVCELPALPCGIRCHTPDRLVCNRLLNNRSVRVKQQLVYLATYPSVCLSVVPFPSRPPRRGRPRGGAARRPLPLPPLPPSLR
jgi:hypothetical protein